LDRAGLNHSKIIPKSLALLRAPCRERQVSRNIRAFLPSFLFPVLPSFPFPFIPCLEEKETKKETKKLRKEKQKKGRKEGRIKGGGGSAVSGELPQTHQ